MVKSMVGAPPPPPPHSTNDSPPTRRFKSRAAAHGRHTSSGSVWTNSSMMSGSVTTMAGPIRTLTYNDRNHLAVLTQLHGSVWPKVLPFCILNVGLTYLVYALKNYKDIDLTFSPSGHKFMAVLVSFLVVSRVSILFARFMQARAYLAETYKCCRELVQHMCVLSMHDQSDFAKSWRKEVAYRTILLLRVTMATVEFQSSQKNPWELPEIHREDQDECAGLLKGGSVASEKHRRTRWATGSKSFSDTMMRAPFIMMYNLRREIMYQRKEKLLQKRHPCNEFLKLLDFVTAFNKAFHGLIMLITTPFPFPLVQMARTFLFFWVFTLPLTINHNVNERPHEPMSVMFFLTYGFIGLEYVSMELDDPYGDDPNDFDDLGMAQIAFEDIYIAIYKCDGENSAHDLRRRITRRMRTGSALGNFANEYKYGFVSPHASRLGEVKE